MKPQVNKTAVLISLFGAIAVIGWKDPGAGIAGLFFGVILTFLVLVSD